MNNFPCNKYPVKFLSCCDVMDCLNIGSEDNSVTVEKSDCGVDLSVTANNIDNILTINDAECITFVKEFVDGKLVITPVVDWNCVAGHVCPICSAGGNTPNLVFSWDIPIDALVPVDIGSAIDGTYSAIDWGDGTVNMLTSHTYASVGTYTVSIYDSNTTKLEMKSTGGTFGRPIRSLTALPSTVLSLIIYLDSIFADLSVLSSHTNLTTLRINNELGGLASFPALTPFTALQSLTLIGYNTTVVNITNNTLLTTLTISTSPLTTITGFSTATLLNTVSLGGNHIGVAQVNTILQALDANGLSGGTITINSQTPAAAPTGAGATAKTALLGKGWTVTTD